MAIRPDSTDKDDTNDVVKVIEGIHSSIVPPAFEIAVILPPEHVDDSFFVLQVAEDVRLMSDHFISELPIGQSANGIIAYVAMHNRYIARVLKSRMVVEDESSDGIYISPAVEVDFGRNVTAKNYRFEDSELLIRKTSQHPMEHDYAIAQLPISQSPEAVRDIREVAQLQCDLLSNVNKSGQHYPVKTVVTDANEWLCRMFSLHGKGLPLLYSIYMVSKATMYRLAKASDLSGVRQSTVPSATGERIDITTLVIESCHLAAADGRRRSAHMSVLFVHAEYDACAITELLFPIPEAKGPMRSHRYQPQKGAVIKTQSTLGRIASEIRDDQSNQNVLESISEMKDEPVTAIKVQLHIELD